MCKCVCPKSLKSYCILFVCVCVCVQVESERRARDVLHYRSTVVNRRPGQRAAVMGTEAVRGELVKAEEVRSVNVLVKGDVLGRVEALLGVLQQEQPDKLRLNVISSGVGPVSDGDVELAASTKSESVCVRVRVCVCVCVCVFMCVCSILYDACCAHQALSWPMVCPLQRLWQL